jgi:GT2 family glycosyltransferase
MSKNSKKSIVGISIVSHGNTEDIISNHGAWSSYSNKIVDFKVAITDNIGDPVLEGWALNNNYHYKCNLIRRGFGVNNNSNFEYLRSIYNLDYFLVINPDVTIDVDRFGVYFSKIDRINFEIMGAKVLEKDMARRVSQNRRFPALFDPIFSLVLRQKFFLRNPHISEPTDWVDGSFMLIKSEAYQQLAGFDETFFLYYEDVDLCKRAHYLNMVVYYNAELEYFHGAQRKGRKVGSKHFFWNLQSMIRFFWKHPTIKLLTITKYD